MFKIIRATKSTPTLTGPFSRPARKKTRSIPGGENVLADETKNYPLPMSKVAPGRAPSQGRHAHRADAKIRDFAHGTRRRPPPGLDWSGTVTAWTGRI